VQFAAETVTREPVPTLGDRIRAQREAKRLTQAALAERLGVSIHTIIAWEKGVRMTPQADNLAKIADFLEVTMKDLLGTSVWTVAARERATSVPGADARVPQIAGKLPDGKRREFLDRLRRLTAEAEAAHARLEKLRAEAATTEAEIDGLHKARRAEIEVMEIVLEKLKHSDPA